MSGSELPSSSNQSVFSMFGFTGSHYTEADDFDHPLESAPDSFIPTEVTETLRSRQLATRKNPKDQTASNFDVAAQKRLINFPENTKLVLQSLSHTGIKVFPEHPHHLHHLSALEKHQQFTRRYSNPQGEEVEDSFDTDVIHKFRSTVCDSSRALLSQHHNTQQQLYNNWSSCAKDDFLVPENSVASSSLPRRQSTPNLTACTALLTLSPNKSFCLSPSESSVDPDTHTSVLTSALVQQVGGLSVTNPVRQMDQEFDKPQELDAFYTPGELEKSGFNILAHTRRLGAWLTKATEGEKVKVTKNDLNVLAPNSF